VKSEKLRLLKNIISANHSIFLIVLLSLVLTAVWNKCPNDSPDKVEPADITTLDTLIPEGFSLVNIEIVNAEKLDAILGQFGVVDLFLANEDGKKTSKKIASKVKILRAPKNPQEFAVLVPEAQVSELFSYDSPFYASIQNPIPTEANRKANFEKRAMRFSRITTE